MSNRIPQPFINDLIARTDLVALIEARVKLTKKGQNYSGLCPFHQEKSPSFTVSPQKQFYYCFGCGASGNALGFLMAYDHLEFLEAITQLSTQLGLELPQTNTEIKTFEEDYELLEIASSFFQQQLRHSQEAITYLKSRGLTGRLAKTFKLGYAPDLWDGLLNHCQHYPNAVAKLVRNGLLIQKEPNKLYDRFRHRIIFPIHDHRGRVIAFGGRALNDELPKYLNSPETSLFHKSQELYGLHEALAQTRKPKNLLVTEGYMDVIALHQYGVTNAVATLGTATNPKHLQKLFRYTEEVIFCFDGDKAGQTAAWKALTTNLPYMRDGIQLRFMFLPEGDDPDSLIRRHGANGFLQRVARAEPLSRVFFALIRKEIPLTSPDQKAHYAKIAAEYLNQMPSGIFRELMFEQLAKELHVYKSDLDSLQHSQQQAKPIPRQKPQSTLTPSQKAIALVLQEPKLARECDAHTLQLIQALPKAAMLVKLLTLLQQSPKLTLGELMTYWEEPTEQQDLARLAAFVHPFPREGMLAEFKGAVSRVVEHTHEILLNALISKAKNAQLTLEEKKKLNDLLTQQHKHFI